MLDEVVQRLGQKIQTVMGLDWFEILSAAATVMISDRYSDSRSRHRGRLYLTRVAPVQRSPKLFLLVPSPTWMPAPLFPDRANGPIDVNCFATQRISYAHRLCYASEHRNMLSPITFRYNRSQNSWQVSQ
jgi:hypothetical protein